MFRTLPDSKTSNKVKLKRFEHVFFLWIIVENNLHSDEKVDQRTKSNTQRPRRIIQKDEVRH
jgi:hypothetical protein